jgi:hypothetical protein
MRRFVFSFAIGALLISGVASAHEQESRIDAHDRDTPLDLRQVTFDHNGTNIFGDITTYGGFSNSTVGRRGFIAIDVWKGSWQRDGYYRLIIRAKRRRLTGTVYRGTYRPDEELVRIGSAPIDRVDSNELAFRLRRSLVEARGAGVKWSADSLWHADSCGDSAEEYYCKRDTIPTRRKRDDPYYFHRFR